MADGKIGVGATVGIVLGVTAVLGLGLYFILRPKSSTSSVTSNYVPPPTNTAEADSYRYQLEILKQQNENAKGLAKAQNDAQINGLLIALGGKVAGAGLDRLISGLSKTPKKDPYILDYNMAFTGFTGNQWY